MSFSKLVCLSLSVAFFASSFSVNSFAQERSRVVEVAETPQTAVSPAKKVLTNKIVVGQPQKPLVTKTSSSRPTSPAGAAVSKATLRAALKSNVTASIEEKLGLPYRYGSTGPNSYDCSGLVWTVFNEAGINFGRSSARTFWSEFEPVEGDDRYAFGTLVFFNGLGHVGIVVDKDGFYHASSSKGVMYSKFKGYWEKRIVGFRRIPLEDYLY